MVFDLKNYPNFFIRGERVKSGFTTNIRKNLCLHPKKKTERLMDTSEGEALHFIEVYGQRLMIVTLGTAGIGK